MTQATNMNEIDFTSKEGKFLSAAMSLLNSELYTDNTKEDILKKIEELSNKLHISNEDKLKKDLKETVINSFINKYYNKETGKPLENHSDIPEFVSNEIDMKIIDLIDSLKKFGIFNVNNV